MRKGKINIVDVFVIIAIVAVAALALWYIFLRDTGTPGAVSDSPETQAVIFTAKATELEPDAIASIQVGDRLVALDTYQPGEIMAIEIEPSKSLVAIDGNLVLVEDEHLVDMTVTIKANPNRQEAYMDLGNQQIIVGNAYWIKTKDMHAQSVITSIVDR